jgi:hypothetical protein
MIEGLSLGVMTFASLLITFWKLPKRIQQWILKHKFLADLAAGAIVYMILGAISKSIIAIVGAISAGLLVGLSLEAAGAQRLVGKRSSAGS